MIDKYLIEKFRLVDFFGYIKKNIFSFTFLFTLLNIFAFTSLHILEKDFNNKIKFQYQTKLSILLINDLIKNNHKLNIIYSPIIGSNINIKEFISKFDENYAFDCISKYIEDDNNFQETKISNSNTHTISVEFKNDLLDEQILDNIIDECNSKYLENFLINYNVKLNTFIEDFKFEIKLLEDSIKQNWDLLDGFDHDELSKNLLDDFDKNTFDLIINTQKFDFFYKSKRKIKSLQNSITNLKNLDFSLKNNTEFTFIKINKLDVSKILPRYSPSSYQIFLFFNIVLICIFLFFFILRMNKND